MKDLLPMIDILAYTPDHLIQVFEKNYGKGRFHAEALLREVIKKGNPTPLDCPEFRNSPKFARALEKSFRVEPGEISDCLRDGNLTKFITRLSDGHKIESVIIPMTRYNTLCVSSQVGCRMGCGFCQTGRMGFKRQLSVSEITGQLYNARHVLGKIIKNVVFMGMGEPFDNFDTVLQAVRVMNQQKGFDIALRHITLSTAGLVPGIGKLARAGLAGVRLAVSVNGADNVTRTRLMPVNRSWPLEALKQALLDFPLPRRGTFLLEYILIKGVNDSPAHARNLSDFIRPLPVRLNLIPCNTVPGTEFESPGDTDMQRFARDLTDRGIFVIKRWSKGRSVSAGCGQLGTGAGDGLT